MQTPIVLLVLDGWGIAPQSPGNATSLAHLPNLPRLWNSYPHTYLSASGEAVGLPKDEDGNTETGHMNIGAGRVVYQDLPRINMSIADQTFFKNKALVEACKYARKHHSNLHLMGLLSDGSVHANYQHLLSLLELAKHQGVGRHNLFLHLFTDGRDSPPQSAKTFFADLETKLHAIGVGTVATIMGRFYGMDRDRRWDRTEKAYVALTEGTQRTAANALAAIDQSYKEGVTDEFIEPTVILDEKGKPYPRIRNNDAVIFYNFRIDRPRQITKAFILPHFEEQAQVSAFDPYAVKYHGKHLVEVDTRSKPFARKVVLQNLRFVTMTEYEKNLPCDVAFPPSPPPMTLGETIAQLKLRQLRMAETEKERFVTYYFNGLRETAFSGEDHLIIPSPKVATYDLQPEMAANEITSKLLERITQGGYSLIVVNFANADMVAHTGNIPAAVKACETVDACVGKIVEKILAVGGTCAITADHGNVEEMLGTKGQMDTEHSTYPVPFILIDKELAAYPHELPQGKLGDIAPTLLALKGYPIPKEMTGTNLLATLLAQIRPSAPVKGGKS